MILHVGVQKKDAGRLKLLVPAPLGLPQLVFLETSSYQSPRRMYIINVA